MDLYAHGRNYRENLVKLVKEEVSSLSQKQLKEVVISGRS